MTIDLAAGEYVRQLRDAGPRPNESLIRHIVRSGDAAFTPLLALATSLELFDEDEPQVYAPLHALRLLGEMPKVEMIDPLMRKYPVQISDEQDKLPQAWGSETPQIIGRLGEAAIAPLWAIVDSTDWPREARTIAIVGLASAATFDPSQRDTVVAGLFERLRSTSEADARTMMAIGLSSLGVGDAYGEVMGLFREGKLDKQILAPGVARQLLLSGGEKGLNCTKHTLQERYEQHGPAAS